MPGGRLESLSVDLNMAYKPWMGNGLADFRELVFECNFYSFLRIRLLVL